MKSPLDFDSNPINKPSGSKGEGKGKKEKLKGTSPLKNPIIKEIMPLGIYAGLTLAFIGGSLFYTNSVNTDYALANYDKAGNISSLESQLENQMTQRGAIKAELENAQNRLSSLSLSMEEQNMMKTPLTQGYYFISYLTYLAEKYELHLEELKVLASDGSGEIDLTTVHDASGTYDLLPIEVNLVATTTQLQRVLDEMYTKRIIQVKNLNITNNLDSTVRAQFQVYFSDAQAIADQQQQVDQAIGNAGMQPPATDPVTGQPITPPTGQPTDGQPIGGQPTGGGEDQVIMEGGNGSSPEEGTPIMETPEGNGNNMEVNNGAGAQDPTQQHYEQTGQIVDPISGEVINE